VLAASGEAGASLLGVVAGGNSTPGERFVLAAGGAGAVLVVDASGTLGFRNIFHASSTPNTATMATSATTATTSER
jgi:hypothetical protein